MSYVYVVTAIAHNKLEVLETYAGIQSALARAWGLATSRHDLSVEEANASPLEERLPDGSIRWVVLQNAHAFVGIFFKEIQTALLAKKDLAALDGLSYAWIPPSPAPRGFDGNPPLTKPAPFYDVFSNPNVTGVYDPSVYAVPDKPAVAAFGCSGVIGPGYNADNHWKPAPPKDNPGDESLPGGWNSNGKPITMKEVYADPTNVVSHPFLSTTQRWALTRARISKRPHYTVMLSDGLYVQSAALQCLGSTPRACNEFGCEIISHEMGYLSDLVYNLQI